MANLKQKTAQLLNQTWRGDDGTEMDGLTLAKRMLNFGVIKTLEGLCDAPLGFVLKTGVSAWERIK